MRGDPREGAEPDLSSQIDWGGVWDLIKMAFKNPLACLAYIAIIIGCYGFVALMTAMTSFDIALGLFYGLFFAALIAFFIVRIKKRRNQQLRAKYPYYGQGVPQPSPLINGATVPSASPDPPQEMISCRHCGASIPKNVIYCPQCGNRLQFL